MFTFLALVETSVYIEKSIFVDSKQICCQ